MPSSLFRPGNNCAAVARAGRVALLVDAAAYFEALADACRGAERSIIVLGWDFDSRTPLGADTSENGITAGAFFDALAAAKRRLRIRILDWDFPIVYGRDRELPHTTGLAWKPHRRIDFRFDDTHPLAGSHHQKIVVIDDRLAFCGGLDITGRRWDTPAHEPDDARRMFNGAPYPPMHDVMIAVDGEAARAVGEIARQRWRAATGEAVELVEVSSDPWPAGLAPCLRDVDAAIACTAPPAQDDPGVRHVEQLYLDMIAAARRYIYVENQYFTSETVAAALAESLARPDGPEIVLVTRLMSHGWLEELTMTVLRSRFVRALRDADRHTRFSALYPHVAGLPAGTCIDLHSKVMIADDEWLRVGSSNLSNRSMGMDTECDVVIEALGDARRGEAIRAFRDSLLAEHLGTNPLEVARSIEISGTMSAAIEALGTDSRRLARLEAPDLPQTQMALAEVGDPGEPVFETIVRDLTPAPPAERSAARRVVILLGIVVAAAAGLALAWTTSPLAHLVTRENAMGLAETFSLYWWAPIAVVAAYTPASLVMFPRWILTMAAVIAFGPWKGFVLAMTGAVIAGVVSFLPGRLVGPDTLRRLAGQRLHRVARLVERRGLLSVALVRLVPVAPFPVVNLVLGAMRVRLRHFVLGTMAGMLPGMLAATVLSDQLAVALEDPARVNGWLIAGALLVIAALAYLGQRVLRGRAH